MLATPTAPLTSSDYPYYSPTKMNALNAPLSATETRLVSHVPSDGTLAVTARAATPLLASVQHTAKRRRVDDGDDGEYVPMKYKKSRGSPKRKARSRTSTPPPRIDIHDIPLDFEPYHVTPDPEREYTRRSRSVSELAQDEMPEPREVWIDEEGRPGPGVLSSEKVVKSMMRTYKAYLSRMLKRVKCSPLAEALAVAGYLWAKNGSLLLYFKNPSDPTDNSFRPHPLNPPWVELEYPNTFASERFILLAPKDEDHYNPIFCLESTLNTIVSVYMTPEQQALFGTLPNSAFTDEDAEDDDGTHNPMYTRGNTSPARSSSSATSRASSLTMSSSSPLTPEALATICSLSSITRLSSYATQRHRHDPPAVDYLRLFRRAMHRRDGPLFKNVMQAVNALLRSLKYPPLPTDTFLPAADNVLRAVVRSWSCIPREVVERIIEETYQRAVGPRVPDLNRYEAFSSEVYGELLPSFVSQIISATGLNQNSLFLDLGSGVGNVVLQASLQTGCTSYGIEIKNTPADIARSQLEQFRKRCRMWGVRVGEVELEEGDMLTSKRVDELIPKADVVLINNKVFEERLNAAVTPKFLDLKEGAIVVSLKPFVSSTRLSERNLDDISGIFIVSEKTYKPGSVSWSNMGGSYFLHRVDREGYADIKQRLESTARIAPARTTRSRR